MEKSISTVGRSDQESTTVLTICLLIFSLLPGGVKIFGAQFLFLLNIPVVLSLFFLKDREPKYYRLDVIFFFFFFLLILQTVIWSFFPFVNKIGLYMGFYMYIFPMIGFFISRRIELETYIHTLITVCFIHAIIGIIIYPMFGLGVALGDFAKKLREGTGIIRMGSVSGSLGFGNLMLVGFVSSLALKKNRLSILFFFCIICSMQRSAWLAGVFSLLAAFFLLFDFRKALWMSAITLGISSLAFFVFENKFSEALFSRLDQIGSNAAGERSDQWNGGIENFLSYPLGSGVGQVGQVGTRYENNENFNKVPDGDFFRILSEAGIGGAMFYLSFFVLLSICVLNIGSITYYNRFICIMLIAYSIQMIGSNITEFYFTNFVYWIFVGFFFKSLRIVQPFN